MTAPTLVRTPLAHTPLPASRPHPSRRPTSRRTENPPAAGFALYVDLGTDAFSAMPDEVIRAAETLRELAHEWLPEARTRTVLTRGGHTEAPPARPESTLRARLAAIPDAPVVHVDVKARLVTVDGERVHLTTKEFDLLAALATAEGRVLTREQLHATVWRDRPVSGSSRTVDVHVRRLRSVPGLAELITTARGAGYRIPVRRQLQVTA